MLALGPVVNVTRRGQAVARAKGAATPEARPRIGARVTDARGRDVGKVQDLIGPVREPYVIVACGRGADPRRLLGQELFIRHQ